MTRGTPALVALLLAAFVINLDTTLVNVALPTLVGQIHAGTTQLQWVVDAYNLVFAALLLAAGSLSDRLGRKGVLLVGLGVFASASIAGGFASTPSELIGARAVMGLGAALTFPATLSLLSNIFVERRARARAIGLWGASAGVAIAMGPIVGGWLLEHFAWPSVFFALAPVAAAAAGLIALWVPTSRDAQQGGVDLGGAVLATAAMGLLVFSIIEAPTTGWSSARTLAGFAGSVALATTFVLYERRLDRPMLDVGLFRNPRFSAASASVTVSFFTLFGFIFLMTQYFQFIRGYGPLGTGVRLLPVAISVGLGSVVGTQLAVRRGTKLVVTAGLVAMTAFYLWVAAVTTSTVSYGLISVQMVVYGLGLGLTSAPATESIMGAVSTRQAGVGSAVNDTTRLLGGTLGVAIIGSVYASLYSSHLSRVLTTRVPSSLLHTMQQSVGSALQVAQVVGRAGHPLAAAQLHGAARDAFLHGLSVGCLVAAGVALVGTVLAAAWLPAQPTAVASNADDAMDREPAASEAPTPDRIDATV